MRRICVVSAHVKLRFVSTWTLVITRQAYIEITRLNLTILRLDPKPAA
jgi:hypothetical protein